MIEFDHDRVATRERVMSLFALWLSIHTYKRMPKLTAKRVFLLSSTIQKYGFNRSKTYIKRCGQKSYITDKRLAIILSPMTLHRNISRLEVK